MRGFGLESLFEPSKERIERISSKFLFSVEGSMVLRNLARLIWLPCRLEEIFILRGNKWFLSRVLGLF